MFRALALVVLLLLPLAAAAAPATPSDPAGRVADVDWLVDQIAAHYAYLPERHLDLAKLRALYEPVAAAAQTRADWLHVLERLVGELHDHHATLGANVDGSPQLAPTGTDLWAEVEHGRARLTEVRPGGPAAAAGLRSGDEVLAIDGAPARRAIAAALPRALAAPDPEAASFALRTLLAGTHVARPLLRVRGAGGRVRTVQLAPYTPPQADAPVTWRWLRPGIGYIRLENSLGDTDTIAAFDAALAGLHGARGLILDLRNTPSGGDTDVAEPILGRFIAAASPYQRVFDPGPGKQFPRDSWLKFVQPRGPLSAARLVVLVDHWTGSMGEGVAIGLDGMHRATVVGTRMAGLSGGTGRFALPHTGVAIDFPVEQLYHLDGRPRERFVPPALVDLARAPPDDDAILARGLAILQTAR